MITQEQVEKLKKFTQDPDWVLMENILRGHIEPLLSVETIQTAGKSNDEIAAEVRGRQISIESLTKFLGDAKIINGKQIGKPTTFK